MEPLRTIVNRKRMLPQDGGGTLFFHAPGFGKSGVFFEPGDVPQFDGEAAEFEYTRIRGKIVLGRLVRVIA
jgi:hypothetical protein